MNRPLHSKTTFRITIHIVLIFIMSPFGLITSQSCDCTDFVYLNDVQNSPAINSTHKFKINVAPNTLTMQGNPWHSWAGTSNSPHGLAVDVNGFLYIGEGFSGPIHKLTCDGGTVSTDAFPGSGGSFNFVSNDGLVFINPFGSDQILAFDPCTGSSAGSLTLSTLGTPMGGGLDGLPINYDWGFSQGDDGKFYSIATLANTIPVWKYDFTNGASVAPIFNLSFSTIASTIGNGFTNGNGAIRAWGIDADASGNIYILLEDIDQTSSPVYSALIKVNSTGTIIDFVLGEHLAIGGFGQGQGVVYHEGTNQVFVAGGQGIPGTGGPDCVATYTASTLDYVSSASIPYVDNQNPKGIAIGRECCPSPANQTIAVSQCFTPSQGQKLFLSNLFPCDGPICGTNWNTAGTTGFTFNACDNTVTANATGPYCVSATMTAPATANCPTALDIDITIGFGTLPNIMATGDQTICGSQAPAQLTGSGTASTYQWQISTTSSTSGFSDIAGANMINYTPGAITQTSYFRLIGSNNTGCTPPTLCQDTSNVVTLTFFESPTATFTVSAPTCSGSTPNNNGSIVFNTASTVTNFGISAVNAVSYNGPAYPATTFAGGTQSVLSAIPNTGGSYIVRIFNGAAGCFTDVPVSVNAVNCAVPCSISAISFANQTSCDDNGTDSNASGDDYFTADITVTFAGPPASGNLVLSGDVLAGGGSLSVPVGSLNSTTSHTFVGVRLVADGTASSVTATFDSEPTCTFSISNGPAVQSCSNYTIADPCTCFDVEYDAPETDPYEFLDSIRIEAPTGETWFVTSATGIEPIDTNLNISFTFPIPIPETSPGVYSLRFAHTNGVGYSLVASNGTQELTIGNFCQKTMITVPGLQTETICNLFPEVTFADVVSATDPVTGLPVPGTFTFDIINVTTGDTTFNALSFNPGDYSTLTEIEIRGRYVPDDLNGDCPHTFFYAFEVGPDPCVTSVSCDCDRYVYLNDVTLGITHKFRVEANGVLTEVFGSGGSPNPWFTWPGLTATTPSGGNVVIPAQPHGLAQDINGNIYIAQYLGGPTFKFDCDANVIADNYREDNLGSFPFTSDQSGGTNFFSIGNYVYANFEESGGNQSIGIYPLCTPSGSYPVSRVGTIILNGSGPRVFGNWTWGLSEGEDGLVYATQQSTHQIWRWNPTSINNMGTSNVNVTYDISSIIATRFGTPTDFQIQGIDADANGFMYIYVIGTGATSGILKLDNMGLYLDHVSFTNSPSANLQSPARGLGLVYDSSSDLVYVAGGAQNFADCVSAFSASTLDYVPTSSIAHVQGQDPKGIAISTECCGSGNNTTIINKNCNAAIGDKIFLQEITGCEGPICNSTFTLNAGSSGISYDPCDQSITLTGVDACANFTLSSPGSAQCPDPFNVVLKLAFGNITAPTYAAPAPVCAGTNPPAFTISTPASASGTPVTYLWQQNTTSCTSNSWVAAPGVNNQATYDPGVITATTYYRVIVTAPNCTEFTCMDTSACLTLSVNPKPTATAPTPVCNGAVVANLQLMEDDPQTGGTWSAQAGNPTGATVNASTGLVTFSAGSSNQTYNFIYTTALGCRDTVTFTTPSCQPTIQANLGDPCVCFDVIYDPTGDPTEFADTLYVTAPASQTWCLTMQTGMEVRDSFVNRVMPQDTCLQYDATIGKYFLPFAHTAGVGYSATVSNGTTTLMISNTCFTLNPGAFTVQTEFCSNDPIFTLPAAPAGFTVEYYVGAYPGTPLLGSPPTFDPSTFPNGSTFAGFARYEPIDPANCPVTREAEVVVYPAPMLSAPTITCNNGTANNITLTSSVSGGTWSASATNPTGATIVPTTGEVSFTAAASNETFTFIYTTGDNCIDSLDVMVPECCPINDISLTNISTCIDNGTRRGFDDYFTADVVVNLSLPISSGETLTIATNDTVSSNATSLVMSGPLAAGDITFASVRFKADGTATQLSAIVSGALGCTVPLVNGTSVAPCPNLPTVQIVDPCVCFDVEYSPSEPMVLLDSIVIEDDPGIIWRITSQTGMEQADSFVYIPTPVPDTLQYYSSPTSYYSKRFGHDANIGYTATLVDQYGNQLQISNVCNIVTPRVSQYIPPVCSGSDPIPLLDMQVTGGITFNMTWYVDDPNGTPITSFNPDDYSFGTHIMYIRFEPVGAPNQCPRTVSYQFTLSDGAVSGNFANSVDICANNVTNLAEALPPPPIVPANSVITYHDTRMDAEDGVNGSPNSYVSPAVTDSFFVRIKLPNGCFSVNRVDVNVNPLPSVVVNADNLYCPGSGTIDLNSFITASGGTPVFYNTKADAMSMTGALSSSTVNIPASARNYYVRVTSTAGCFVIAEITVTPRARVCGTIIVTP